MINLLKNSEIRRFLFIFGIVAIIATGIAYGWHPKFGVLMLAVSCLFLMLYFVTTYKRYKQLSLLSSAIDQILHGDIHPDSIPSYTEGELAILQSEVYKMTVRLRSQRQLLQDDKIYLANSLADISHQIRTSLTTINLLISFLSDPSISEKRRNKIIQELYDLLSRIEWLITTLLKLSRLDAGTAKFNLESISLDDLLKKATAPLLVPMDLRNQRLYKGKHSDEKSFGIGLSLSRMIITSQNGTIKAENIAPSGAKFTIRFYTRK